MKEPISDQILTAAGALYSEGIRAVGIDRIIEAANVAKATSSPLSPPRIISLQPISRIAMTGLSAPFVRL